MNNTTLTLKAFEENVMLGDLNNSFIAFLADNGKAAHEWDYDDLRDFADALGIEITDLNQ